MAYITKANSKKILHKLNLKNANLKGTIYEKPIYFFSKMEEQSLLAYQMFVKEPQKFITEVYQRVPIKEDTMTYVFEGEAPCYHNVPYCERLHADYCNFRIPKEIIEKGEGLRFRNWFKSNLYLLDGDRSVLEMRINIAFGINIHLEDIVCKNSGYVAIDNLPLNKLVEMINKKLDGASRFYYASAKNTCILKRFSKLTFLAHRLIPIQNNDTGYSDEEVKELLAQYEQEFKKPIIELLQNYYRVKYNPELEMEGFLLEQLGFKQCQHCKNEFIF